MASSAVALDSRIENDRSIRVNCTAADSAVNMEETAPIAAAEAEAMQQRVKKKEYGHTCIGPIHDGPDCVVEPGVGQSVAEGETGQSLTGDLKTGTAFSVCALGGGELSVPDCGGESIHATAVALGKFYSTAPDAANDQLDPLVNVEQGKESRLVYSFYK